MESYFAFRKVWKLTPTIQIWIIVVCYIFITLSLYSGYLETGLMFHMPLNPRLIFAPIYEEVIFRGFILTALLKAVSWKKALVYSSLLFGIWHLKNIFYLGIGPTLYQIFYATFLGLILAYCAIKTKTIWIGVIIHYLNNIWSPISFILLDLLLKRW